MSGIVHTYYAVALAPAIAALVGAGAVDMWKLRERTRFGGLVLGRRGPRLGDLVLAAPRADAGLRARPRDRGSSIVGVSASVMLAFPTIATGRRPALAAAALAVAVLLADRSPTASETVASAHSGGDPSAGPAVAGGGGFGGGGGNGGPPAGAAGFGGGGFGGGGIDQATVDYLVANQGQASWLVATVSAGTAGSIELSTGRPVMAMGGFSGSDPAPTLAELQGYIASGQLRFVILGAAARAAEGVRAATAAWRASGTPGSRRPARWRTPVPARPRSMTAQARSSDHRPHDRSNGHRGVGPVGRDRLRGDVRPRDGPSAGHAAPSGTAAPAGSASSAALTIAADPQDDPAIVASVQASVVTITISAGRGQRRRHGHRPDGRWPDPDQRPRGGRRWRDHGDPPGRPHLRCDPRGGRRGGRPGGHPGQHDRADPGQAR